MSTDRVRVDRVVKRLDDIVFEELDLGWKAFQLKKREDEAKKDILTEEQRNKGIRAAFVCSSGSSCEIRAGFNAI